MAEVSREELAKDMTDMMDKVLTPYKGQETFSTLDILDIATSAYAQGHTDANKHIKEQLEQVNDKIDILADKNKR